jgi:hypothetical protein
MESNILCKPTDVLIVAIDYAPRWTALHGTFRRAAAISPMSQDKLAVNFLRREGGQEVLACFFCAALLEYPESTRVALIPDDWALVAAERTLDFDGGQKSVVDDVLVCPTCATAIENQILAATAARRTA